MKTFLLIFISLSFICLCNTAGAQTKTETIKVSGECGTCKKKIETAARNGGASYASWNINTKVLTVKYNAKSASTAKIEKSIATVGYDTPDYPASEEAYNQLDDCCKYERKATAAKACGDDCMKAGNCAQDGKCSKDKEKAACCSGKEGCKKA
jgi:hypothetical protein